MGKAERCENCGSTFGLSFAHRHKRIWYLHKPELLSDINQVLILCVFPCHYFLDGKPLELEQLFIKLRGEELTNNLSK